MREKKNIHPEGLSDLLSHDCRAKEYYLTLPEDAQGLLQQQTPSIQSLAQMRQVVSALHEHPDT